MDISKESMAKTPADDHSQDLTEAEVKKSEFQMGRISLGFSLLALLTAIAAIAADLAEAETAAYILKPITMLLLIALGGLSYGMQTARYRSLVIAGLVCSLVGDVLLMVPQDLFIFGVAAFLTAQLIYTAAFVSVGGFYRSLTAALPFAIFGLIMGLVLIPGLGDMLIPTMIYMVVILVMGWQALGQWRQTEERRALLAFVGALLFVASDALLAVNRFADPIPLASLLVLGSYYPAQWLIAVSSGYWHR